MKNISMLSQHDNKLNGVIRTLADVTFLQYCGEIIKMLNCALTCTRQTLKKVCQLGEDNWRSIIFWVKEIASLLVPIIDFYLFTKLGINIKFSLGYALQDLHPSIVYWAKVNYTLSQGRLKISPLNEVYPGRGRRYYSTSSKAAQRSFDLKAEVKSLEELVHPYYVSGFSDAESTFSVSLWKREGKTGWGVKIVFSISLHGKDIELLKKKYNPSPL